MRINKLTPSDAILIAILFLLLPKTIADPLTRNRHSLADAHFPLPYKQPQINFSSAEARRVEKLPDIEAFEILSTNAVFVKAPGQWIHYMTLDGGEYDDQHYIEGETGQVKPNANARKTDELIFRVGEAAQLGGKNIMRTYKLLKIDKGLAYFSHVYFGRSSQQNQDEILKCAPYP